jgi:hypothetical protein
MGIALAFLVFSVGLWLLRTILTLLVLGPLQLQIRRSPVAAAPLACVLTGISAWVSAAIAEQTSLLVGNPIDGLALLLIAVPAASLYLLRLVGSLSGTGADRAAYESEWEPEPSASDSTNVRLRLAIDVRMKAWSLLGLLTGVAFRANVQEMATAHPGIPQWILLYLMVGSVVTIFHLGEGDVGAAGLAVTITLGLLFWPAFVIYRVNDWLWKWRMRG